MTPIERQEADIDISFAIATLRNVVKHASDQQLLDQILSGLPIIRAEARDRTFALARERLPYAFKDAGDFS